MMKKLFAFPIYKFLEDIQKKRCQQKILGKVIQVWVAKILNEIMKLLSVFSFTATFRNSSSRVKTVKFFGKA